VARPTVPLSAAGLAALDAAPRVRQGQDDRRSMIEALIWSTNVHRPSHRLRLVDPLERPEMG
jgi:hypothetical protein